LSAAAGEPGGQRRGRSIAMSVAERDAFLAEQRVCRIATTDSSGPHVSPLWFVWDGRALWLYSVVRSRRWADIEKDARVAVVVDAGEDYRELRGVELLGAAEPVGEVPRAGEPDDGLARVEQLFARKYRGADTIDYDLRHAWLRVVPTKVVSWDFRKLRAPGSG